MKPSLLEPLFLTKQGKENYELLLDKLQVDIRRPMKKSLLEVLLKVDILIKDLFSKINVEISRTAKGIL